ncbi:hypothetical protein ACFQZ4_01940 [Catellatospora coxensis]
MQPGAEVTFATVVESARRRGESAIGFRRRDDADQPRSTASCSTRAGPGSCGWTRATASS